MNHRYHWHVPAKALLFGEYGGLFGSPMLALTFFGAYLDIKIALTTSAQASVHIRSAFYPSGECFFHWGPNEPPSPSDPFFLDLLKPWQSLLKQHHYQLNIEILGHFSPSFGFGSSSALIAAVHTALWRSFYGPTDFQSKAFWRMLYASLHSVQKGLGSGYDVAVQVLSLVEAGLTPSAKLWLFQKKNHSTIPYYQSVTLDFSIAPTYENGIWQLHPLGYFIPTTVYAPTASILKKTKKKKHLRRFAKRHGVIARKACHLLGWGYRPLVLRAGHLSALACLVKQSLRLAQQQGLTTGYTLPVGKKSIYKTMGAGFGDCIWCLHVHTQSISEA